jgi:hypothetical protein
MEAKGEGPHDTLSNIRKSRAFYKKSSGGACAGLGSVMAPRMPQRPKPVILSAKATGIL